MQLQDQVITLQQAKRLAELGVKAPAVFYNYESIVNGKRTFETVPFKNFINGAFETNESVERALNKESKNECYPAYTVAELGMMIPLGYTCIHVGWHRHNAVHHRIYSAYKSVHLEKDDDGNGKDWLNAWCSFSEEQPSTEAQARAAMLIYLLENNYITPQQINEI